MNKLNCRVRGRFSVLVRSPDGEVREAIKGRPNLITNTGMDALFTNNTMVSTTASWMGYCSVGSGTTPPSESDTALAAPVARVSFTGTGTGTAWQGNSLVYTSRYEFPAGSATGVLSEIGLSSTTSSSSPLNTRALFTDEGGSPVTVTVLEDEQLIVLYEIIFDVSSEDSVLTVVTGPTSTEYTITLRPANYGNLTSSWNMRTYRPIYPSTSASNRHTVYYGSGSGLGPVTGTPVGSTVSGAESHMSLVDAPYTPGSHTRTLTVTIPLTAASWNDREVGAVLLQGGGMFYQLGFSPRVQKTNQQIVQLDLAWSIERA